MAEKIRLRTALDKGCRPVAGEFLTTVLLELSPSRQLQRLPLNLGILIDTSESMQEAKLEHAKAACRALLDRLAPNDVFSIVSFGSVTSVLIPAQSFGANSREQAERGLAGLRAEGVTALVRGLDEIYGEVRRNAGRQRTSFVILLSDGFPTTQDGFVDHHTEPYISRVDREMQERGICLTAIGLGDAENYDQRFLRSLADAGNGQFIYCGSPAELAHRFEKEFERIQRTVLADVQLACRHLTGQVRRLWRVYPDKKLFEPPQLVDGRFAVPLGSFQDEQPQAFLLEVVTPGAPGGRPGRARLLEAEVAWHSDGGPRKVVQPVIIEYTDDPRALAQRDEEVVRLATECLDALLEEELEEAVREGDASRQTNVLARKKKLTMRLGKAEATRVLEEMEEALASGEAISQDALARSSQATKPTQRLG